jgi:hypothetical protein
MDFAVSTIFLVVLLLPGFILQTAYTKGFWRWNSPTSARSLTEQIPAAIILAAILHLAWASFSSWLGYPINLAAVTMLLIGSYGHEEKHFDSALGALAIYPYRIFWYFIGLYSISAALGYISHSTVRKLRLDRSTRVLRFNNQWFYLLSGEITQFKEAPETYPELDGVLLTTIVHHEGGDYLYTGLVADFFFDTSGDLDRVLLRLVSRRKLSEDLDVNEESTPEAADTRYYEIEGDYFVLRYGEMSTMNIDYIFVTPEEESLAVGDIPPEGSGS